jgi:bifunctional DNA-binding transcriptional regulator/antitoxin component of YhaV-PrlF toxin-antitoxin module
LVEKFETKLIQLGEFLRVAIPHEIQTKLNLNDQTPVIVSVNKDGNIELEIQLDGGAAMTCSICNHKKASHKCINCGRKVCLSCYWAFGSLCKKCAKKV